MNVYKLACVSASLSVLLLAAPFANSASGGVIRFTGAIVDGGCIINNSQRDVNIQCYDNGKKTNTVASINSSKINFPSGQVTNVKWLNTERTLGIMNVVYQ